MLTLRAVRSISPIVLLCGSFVSVAQTPSFESFARQAASARESGQNRQAIAYYRQALALRPDWDEGLWYLGSLYYDTDKYSEAVPVLRKLVALHPDAAPAWSLLGLSEFELKNYPHSLSDLQHAVDLGSQDDPAAAKVAQYHLALLLNLNGKFDAATKLLSAEFGQGPVPEQIKTTLGMALLQIPLLPEQVDPSHDALLQSAGEAASLTAQGNFDQAEQILQQMLSEYPETPRLHLAYASILSAAGRPNDAIAQLNQQLRLTPKLTAAHEGLADLLEKNGQFAEAAKEHAAARQAAASQKDADVSQVAAYAHGSSQLRAGNPAPSTRDRFDQLVHDASADQQAGRFDAALAAYKQAVTIRPQWDEGWSAVGRLYYMTDRCAQAIPAFTTASRINPKRSEPWALRGICEFQAKDYSNALIHLQQAEELGFAADSTGVKIAKYHIAYLLNLDGKFDLAMDQLISEAGPSPVAEQIRLAMGLALLRIPRLPDQLDPAQRALVEKAGSAAEMLAQSRYDQSFVIFQQMLADAPNTPFLHYAYGVALASNSQYPEAQAQLREEIRVNPSSALPHLRVASIALLLHSPQDALAAAQKAAGLAPESPEVYYLMGRASLELKLWDEAVKELEAAAKLAPGSPGVHFNLAKAYVKAGKLDAAERERQIFNRLNAQAEQMRSTRGSQTYAGSHRESGLVAGEAPAPQNPK